MNVFMTLFYKIRDFIKRQLALTESIAEDIRDMNVNRTLLIVFGTMLVNMALIFMFSLDLVDAGEGTLTWSTGIIATHFIVFIFMFFTGSLVVMKKLGKLRNISMNIISFVVASVMLSFAVALSTFDQLVTSSISPYLIVCISVGIILMQRPLASLVLYSLSYIAFSLTIGIYQPDPDILLSNRVNAMVVVLISIIMSILLWKNHADNIWQRRYIEKQQQELENKNQLLEHMAFQDPLTSLYNRRRFQEVALNELEISIDKDNCLVMLDLDHFKLINDKYGHASGDLVLKKTASLLKTNLRESDIIARWGGEEFLILLSNVGLERGTAIAEKLRKALVDHQMFLEGNIVTITASFGVALVERNNKDPLESGINNADDALYLAKANGRNQVAIYDPERSKPLTKVMINWNKKMECGEHEIDRQHKRLVELAGEMVNTAPLDDSCQESAEKLEKLIEEFLQHCQYEEHILKEINYPLLNEHTAIHGRLAREMATMKEACCTGNATISSIFSYILDNIVIGHMMTEDAKFIPYIKKC